MAAARAFPLTASVGTTINDAIADWKLNGKPRDSERASTSRPGPIGPAPACLVVLVATQEDPQQSPPVGLLLDAPGHRLPSGCCTERVAPTRPDGCDDRRHSPLTSTFVEPRERNRTAYLRITRPGTYVRSGAVLSLVVAQFPLRCNGFLDDAVTPCDGSQPFGMGLVGLMLDLFWHLHQPISGVSNDKLPLRID